MGGLLTWPFFMLSVPGQPIMIGGMQTISTRRLTFPFDNVASTAFFFNEVNPSTTSGQPIEDRGSIEWAMNLKNSSFLSSDARQDSALALFFHPKAHRCEPSPEKREFDPGSYIELSSRIVWRFPRIYLSIHDIHIGRARVAMSDAISTEVYDVMKF